MRRIGVKKTVVKNQKTNSLINEVEKFQLTNQVKQFIYYYVQGLDGLSALKEAGYTEEKPHILLRHMLNTKEVKELIIKGKAIKQEEAFKRSIMDIPERQAILSEKGRADVSDFFTIDENGNKRFKFDKSCKGTKAVSAISIVESVDRDGNPVVNTNIKLVDATKAIDTLNKMDGIYKQDLNVQADIIINLDKDDQNL